MFERCLEQAIFCSREIDAPASAVWSVIHVVDSFDKVLTGVTHVERLDRKRSNSIVSSMQGTYENDNDADDNARAAGEVRVGMKYRIHRVNRDGARYYGDWDVTNVTIRNGVDHKDNNNNDEEGSNDDAQAEILYSITFFSDNVLGGVTASSTWSIRESGGRTVASIGIGFLSTRLFYVAGRLLCGCCLRQRATALTEIDLDDIAAAAEKIAKRREESLQPRNPIQYDSHIQAPS